jgi:hypothetical protein
MINLTISENSLTKNLQPKRTSERPTPVMKHPPDYSTEETSRSLCTPNIATNARHNRYHSGEHNQYREIRCMQSIIMLNAVQWYLHATEINQRGVSRVQLQ